MEKGRKDHKALIVGAFSGQCEILQSPGDTSTTKETPSKTECVTQTNLTSAGVQVRPWRRHRHRSDATQPART